MADSPNHEFDLIQRLRGLRPAQPMTRLGIGDDAAVLDWPTGTLMSVSADTLVAGVHFPNDAPGDWVAARALGSNLSDVAAMGALPRALCLCLTLPALDTQWLDDFITELQTGLARFELDLIGGDTTRGPCTVVTMQVLGALGSGQGLRRSGARIGDDLYISGFPGEAALGLRCLQAGRPHQLHADRASALIQRYSHPEPRIALGLALNGIAHAAIDVSDGLAQDLGHVLRESNVGARLHLHDLPRSAALAAWPDQDQALQALLAGGDDYELVFSAPASQRHAIDALADRLALPLTRFGEVVEGTQVTWLDAADQAWTQLPSGYRHFSASSA